MHGAPTALNIKQLISLTVLAKETRTAAKTKYASLQDSVPWQSNHPSGQKMLAQPPLEVEERYGKRCLLNQSRIVAVVNCGLPRI